jgi:hypothetical protein
MLAQFFEDDLGARPTLSGKLFVLLKAFPSE